MVAGLVYFFGRLLPLNKITSGDWEWGVMGSINMRIAISSVKATSSSRLALSHIGFVKKKKVYKLIMA